MGASTATADGWAHPSTDASKSLLGQRVILWTYLLLCCASLVPFLAIAQPPIVDFANHAARLALACTISDPATSAMYRYQLAIIPNLAVDLVNAPLCGIVGPTVVLKLVTAASLSLIYYAAWLIQQKLFERANAFLFLLPAIAFNLVTTMGYMNFLAGVAVTCLLLALAIGREHRFGMLVVLCNAGGLIIFFCHVFALGFALMLFFGLMLPSERATVRQVAIAALRTLGLFAAPLMLLAFVPRGHEHFSLGFFHKTRMLPALFMAQHVNLGAFGLALLAPLYLLFRNNLVGLEQRMRWPLITVGAFLLVSPCSVGNAIDIDSRILVATAYLFFAALYPRRCQREITFGLAAIAAGVAVFQLWSAATIWTSFSKQVDELREAGRILPARAKVLTVASGDATEGADPLAYSHVTSYLTIDRRIFNPLEFTGVGMQPLSVTESYAAVDTPTGQPYSPELANRFVAPDAALEKLAVENEAGFALRWPRNFDYVVFYHFGRPYNFNPALLSEIRRGSFFSILRVKPIADNRSRRAN